MKATNIFFGVGIAFAIFFLVLSGINTFYPEPKYEDFCENFDANATGQCEFGFEPRFDIEKGDSCRKCDYEAHQTALSDHKKDTFLIKSIIAIIIMIIGSLFIRNLTSVGNGIIVSGIATLISGFIDSFSYGTKEIGILRFLVGVIATALLIFLAVRFYIKKG